MPWLSRHALDDRGVEHEPAVSPGGRMRRPILDAKVETGVHDVPDSAIKERSLSMSHEEFVVLANATEFVMFTRGETGRVLTLDELFAGLLAAGMSRVQKNVDQWPDR